MIHELTYASTHYPSGSTNGTIRVTMRSSIRGQLSRGDFSGILVGKP